MNPEVRNQDLEARSEAMKPEIPRWRHDISIARCRDVDIMALLNPAKEDEGQSQEPIEKVSIESEAEALHHEWVVSYCDVVKRRPGHVWTVEGGAEAHRQILTVFGKKLMQELPHKFSDATSYAELLIKAFRANGMSVPTAAVHAGQVSRAVFKKDRRS